MFCKQASVQREIVNPVSLNHLLKPGSHLCDKYNTSEISISARKKGMFLFSCAYAYVACVMLIAQSGNQA